MIVIVDSDALIGSLYPQDQHFETFKRIRLKLAKVNANLIYPATVIVETVTFLQGRLNKPKLAQQAIALVTDKALNIESVDGEVLHQASSFLDFSGSKHDTFLTLLLQL